MKFILVLYNLFIYIIALPLKKVLCLFLPKLAERETNWKKSLEKLDELDNRQNQKRLWIHSASMGEFEQAKPIIEYIKRVEPSILVIASFFSPSGFNNQKSYEYADSIVYIPFDTIANAEYFISKLKPNLAAFVRYELWLNHLNILNNRKIPTILINATAPNQTIWNKILKFYYKNAYSYFSKIFTVGSKHTDYFQRIGVKTSIETQADTRFSRILEKVEATKNQKILPTELFDDTIVLVAGSTWKSDEDIISKAVAKINHSSDIKITVIYVPHEPTIEHIQQLQILLNKRSVLLSELLNSIDNKEVKIYLGGAIITDSIGKLLKLYGNADIAYIGGGFGAGVHSLTEAAGYSLPLICGPNCHNSPDTEYLLNANALKIVENYDDLEVHLRKLINSKEIRYRIGNAAGNYVRSNANATEIISKYILNSLIIK